MILSKLGSAGVWSSAFSTSIRISRPTRFRPTGTVNPRRSSRARYVRRPQLHAPSPLCARRDRDDGPPDGDGARQHGGERPPDGDAHSMDASLSVPFYLNSSLRADNRLFLRMTGE